MAGTLSITTQFELESLGRTIRGKQGESTAAWDTPFEISVTGTIHEMIGSLATATVVTVYDDDNDAPTDWDYLWYWADQDSYIQLVGSGTNVILKVEQYVPFVLSFDSLLAAADTTIITGGSEPSLTDIDSVVIGNYSGNTMSYHVALID
jgi:hypothetical protein